MPNLIRLCDNAPLCATNRLLLRGTSALGCTLPQHISAMGDAVGGDAFFTLVAYAPPLSDQKSPFVAVCSKCKTHVASKAGRTYNPMPAGQLQWTVGLQICSVRRAAALASPRRRPWPVFVLSLHAAPTELQLYVKLGAEVVSLPSGWRAEDVWRPTFTSAALPQRRADGYLTLYKWHALTMGGYARGVFLDADVAVTSPDVARLFALDIGAAGFAAEHVQRRFPHARLGWQTSTFAFRRSRALFDALLNASRTRAYPAFTNTDQDVFDGVVPPDAAWSLNGQLEKADWEAMRLHHHINPGRSSPVPSAFPPNIFDNASAECARWWRGCFGPTGRFAPTRASCGGGGAGSARQLPQTLLDP